FLHYRQAMSFEFSCRHLHGHYIRFIILIHDECKAHLSFNHQLIRIGTIRSHRILSGGAMVPNTRICLWMTAVALLCFAGCERGKSVSAAASPSSSSVQPAPHSPVPQMQFSEPK